MSTFAKGFVKTEPRPYRKDWIGEHYPLETRYGVATIQPLGWGVRVTSRHETVYEGAKQVYHSDPPLRVNGREGRLGWADYLIDGEGQIVEPTSIIGGDLTANAEAKLREELPPLVRQWLAEHTTAFVLTRSAYLSNRAHTCEESIRELEDALEIYRERLALIEAGDIEVSPYLNGGRGLDVSA